MVMVMRDKYGMPISEALAFSNPNLLSTVGQGQVYAAIKHHEQKQARMLEDIHPKPVLIERTERVYVERKDNLVFIKDKYR